MINSLGAGVREHICWITPDTALGYAGRAVAARRGGSCAPPATLDAMGMQEFAERARRELGGGSADSFR